MGREQGQDANPFHQDDEGFPFGANDLDCAAVLRRYPVDGDFRGMGPPEFGASRLHALYRATWLPFGLRRKLWTRSRQTSLDLSWFVPFRNYWQDVLGGRPLWGPEDLYFLRGLQRLRFANLQVPDGASADTHAEAHCQPEILYFLLQ